MANLPSAIFRKWMHSREEDSGGLTVYRPEGYAFPPARGRDGLEFHPDGTLIYYAIGRGDAPSPISGVWQAATPNQVHLNYPNGGWTAGTLEIVSVDPQVLKVRSL